MFNVIIDTREQIPWEFEQFSSASHKLDTGDYSIEGLENIFAIERKKTVSEIAQNLSESRFKDVLERLSKLKYKYMLCEFSIDDILKYPVGSNIPKSKWQYLKITSQYILKKLTEIQVQYDIHIIFCGDRHSARQYAQSLMKRVYDEQQKN